VQRYWAVRRVDIHIGLFEEETNCFAEILAASRRYRALSWRYRALLSGYLCSSNPQQNLSPPPSEVLVVTALSHLHKVRNDMVAVER